MSDGSSTDPKWSVFLPAVFVVVPLSYLIVLFYLKSGWGLDRRDKACLAGVGICWLVWVVAELKFANSDWLIALPLFALVATDAFASWPLLQNAYRGQESQKAVRWSWGLTFAATVFGILSVGDLGSLEVVYPGYLCLMMGSIAYFSFSHRERKVQTI
jgi:hypothetical protein